MEAKILKKPTAHKADCLLCKNPIEKGDKTIWIRQSTYPGYRVGYICKKHIRG